MNDRPVPHRESALLWRRALSVCAGILFAVVISYWDGVAAAGSQWINTGAYNHCFLIVPISAYMIWAGREDLAGILPRPSLWGAAVILLFSSLWFLAYFSGLAEGCEFAIVGIVQGILLTILGWEVYRRLLVPCLYLWLMVPSGEFLIPPLQRMTAAGAAHLLDWLDIPALREGLTIEVAAGKFIVAPGCAGLNFLLAALALSVPFAQLTYRDWSRRAAFVACMLATAVTGNILRVFLLIVAANFLGNAGNIIDDHLLYGWAFFTLLQFLVMAIGHRYRQDSRPPAVVPPMAGSGPSVLAVAGLALALVIAVPLAARAGWPEPETGGAATLPALSCGGLAVAAPEGDWIRNPAQADSVAAVDCRDGDRLVHFSVALLARSLRRGKLIGLEHWLIDEQWNRIGRQVATETVSGRPVPVQEDVLQRDHRRRLVWISPWAAGAWRVPGIETALADLKSELAGRRRSVLLLLSTDIAGESEAAAAGRLRKFLGSVSLEGVLAENAIK